MHTVGVAEPFSEGPSRMGQLPALGTCWECPALLDRPPSQEWGLIPGKGLLSVSNSFGVRVQVPGSALSHAGLQPVAFPFLTPSFSPIGCAERSTSLLGTRGILQVKSWAQGLEYREGTVRMGLWTWEGPRKWSMSHSLG